MRAGFFTLNPDSAAIPVAAQPIGDFNGGIPVFEGKLCVHNVPTAIFNGGLQYSRDGKLCVTLGTSPVAWVGGLPLGRNGRLCCSVDQPIVSYRGGVPFDAKGLVVIDSWPFAMEDENGDQI